MTQIYRKNEFIIKQFHKGTRKEFMVVNTKKVEKEGFKKSHTHLKSYETSKYIIRMVNKGKINNGLSIYLLGSLARVSDDKRYQNKVKELIESKRNKGKKLGYRNQPEGLIN